MIELLHPPLSLSEGYRFDDINGFHDLMIKIKDAGKLSRSCRKIP